MDDRHNRSSGDDKADLPSPKLEHIEGEGTHLVDPDEFGFSEKEQRAIVRRIDYRLIITVGLMYCISLMDRINMSFARIAGMDLELVLTQDSRYVCVPISFFFPLASDVT